MARTTKQRVQAILGQDYDTVTNPDLTPYIATANSLVTEAVQESAKPYLNRPIADSGTGSRAELLEMWLAAHFYQMSDQGYASRSTQGASGSFRGQSGDGLKATNYGRTALALDTSGALNALYQLQRAHAFYGGTPPCEQSGDMSSY